MVKMLHNYNEGNLAVVPLEVPDARVEKYLAKGWSIAEGENYKKPKAKKGGRTLEVNPDIVPNNRVYDKSEVNIKADDGEDNVDDQTTGVDTGKTLGANDVVQEPIVVDNRKVQTAHPVSGMNQPGLSGKSKEVLLGIAKDEGIEVDPELSKPEVKKAIEDARVAAANEAEENTKPA